VDTHRGALVFVGLADEREPCLGKDPAVGRAIERGVPDEQLDLGHFARPADGVGGVPGLV
jgi:hypothetical protein